LLVIGAVRLKVLEGIGVLKETVIEDMPLLVLVETNVV
tara:strand:- start:1163 stop:1276 length:114 start_codon:yes stop_codon:yes gene_type:complete